jgi:hypothetical protein
MIRRLTGVAAALAGLTLFAGAPTHAAVNTDSVRTTVRSVWAVPQTTATANPWTRDDRRGFHRDRRFYYRRHTVIEPAYVYAAPAPYYRPGWFWHHNHWYQHRRLQSGIWIYF